MKAMTVVAALVVLLGGCATGTTGGDPSTGSTPSPSVSPSPTVSTAPAVHTSGTELPYPPGAPKTPSDVQPTPGIGGGSR